MLGNRMWTLQTDLLLEVLTARLGVPSSLAVADIGCLDGIAESYLAGRFRRLVASDLLQSNLDEARSRGLSAVEWVLQPPVGDPVRLLFEDDEFDAIVAFSLFHHYEHRGRVQTLAEMARISKPGGLLMIVEINPYCPIVWPWRAVQSLLGREELHLIPRKRLRAEAESSGWRMEVAPEVLGGLKYALVLRNLR